MRVFPRTTAGPLERRLFAGIVAAAVAGAIAGCSPAPPGAVEAQAGAEGGQLARNAVAAPANVGERSAAPDPVPPGATEIWQVHYIGQAKVGYGRTRIIPQDDGLVRIEGEEELALDRGGSTVVNRVELVSVEKPSGELVRFQSRVSLPAVTETRGEVVPGGKLQLVTAVQGKTIAAEIPWRPAWGGFFAVDGSLRRRPLAPGQTRTLTALQPLVNQPAEIRLTARDYEETSLLIGSRRLLRIEGEMTVAGVPFETTLWTDERGETWKTVLPALQQTTYRASRELALSKNESVRYDLFDDITVRVQTPLKNGHETQRVVYRARLSGGDPVEAFVSDTAQTVRRIDDQTAEITVQAVRPDQPPQPAPGVEPPTADDLAPNSLIQSDDPRIVRMAAGVAPKETDPWRIAVALERHVRGAITAKNFSQAFASASEVVQTREGDCSEHAVLLAALCRARKIPARCAMGLVYFPQKEGAAFAYHMWTEVWIRDRWIPLDGTLGRGGIGGGHLKLAHSNLQGAGPYAAFLPVFRVLGQLELEIVREE